MCNSFNKPSWDEYFIGMAFVVSLRSHDSQTKHGAVIVDINNHILGTGYNGFPRGMNDSNLPTTRPDKYDWVVHAEENAISNSRGLWSQSNKIYITGQPCFRCAKLLWQNNISEWYIAKRRGTALETEKTLADFNRLVSETKIKIHYLEYNNEWLKYAIHGIGEK